MVLKRQVGTSSSCESYIVVTLPPTCLYLIAYILILWSNGLYEFKNHNTLL